MTNSPTPVEYALALSDEDKSRVFCSLLKELIEFRGGGKGQISITAPDGEWLGYHVPPLAAEAIFAEHGPKLSEEELAEYDRRIKYGTFIPAAQASAELRAEAARLGTRTPVLAGS